MHSKQKLEGPSVPIKGCAIAFALGIMTSQQQAVLAHSAVPSRKHVRQDKMTLKVYFFTITNHQLNKQTYEAFRSF